jgi:hypothetical protein
MNWERCKEAEVAYLRYYTGICLELSKTTNDLVRIVSLEAKYRTWDLPNMKSANQWTAASFVKYLLFFVIICGPDYYLSPGV